jgi:hypothetical protein
MGRLRKLVPAFCLVIFFLFESIINETYKFSFAKRSFQQYLIWYALHLAYAILISIIIFKAWIRFKQLGSITEFVRSNVITLSFTGICLVFWLLTYPGLWIWDEFSVLQNATTLNWDRWQSLPTEVSYIFSLYLIPNAGFLVALQILFCGFCVQRSISYLKLERLGKFWKTAITLCLVNPAIISVVIRPLRTAEFSFLELMILSFFVSLELKTKLANERELANLLFMISLSCAFRIEGLILLLVFIAFSRRWGFSKIVRNLLFDKLNTNIGSKIWIIASIVMIFSGIAYSNIPEQKIITMYSPVSEMLQDKNLSESELITFNKVINVKDAEENPSYTDIPGFWKRGLKTTDGHAISQFEIKFVHHIVNHPLQFFRIKTKTFLAANGLDTNYSGKLPTEFDYRSIENLTNSKFDTDLQPISAPIRKISIYVLGINGDNGFINATRWLVYGAAGWLILLILVLWLHPRNTVKIPATTLLIQGVFVYLLSPASYFSYYAPIVLCSSFLIVYLLGTSKIAKKRLRTGK